MDDQEQGIWLELDYSTGPRWRFVSCDDRLGVDKSAGEIYVEPVYVTDRPVVVQHFNPARYVTHEFGTRDEPPTDWTPGATVGRGG